MSDKINILLLGNGGREHALAWAINKSSLTETLFIAPGNPGTAECGTNVPDLKASDFDSVLKFVEDNTVHLVVVGPEQPLVDGITDFLESKGHAVFGPTKVAAQLEGSKSFAKNVMQKYDIPTAAYESFGCTEWDQAEKYLKEKAGYPIVLKADGLAAGKGVFICHDKDEALTRLAQIKEIPTLKQAAQTLVIEEFMEGEEVSVFAISDGGNARIIAQAQDHKRIGEGDTGLNTGGMGAYCPAPILDDEGLDEVYNLVIKPTIEGMAKEGMPYKGILYCGLMMTSDGPKVVEYNCRFGDPECQAILPRLETDLVQMMLYSLDNELDKISLKKSDCYECCVVLVSGGYPEAYEKGKVITGLNDISDDVLVFQSGTALEGGKLVTAGGRVLSVVGSGKTLKEAIDKTYAEIGKIHFENMYFRKDIGAKGLKHCK